jgi:anti-sigma regulatory factor (Ser/Thr protein kinase)
VPPRQPSWHVDWRDGRVVVTVKGALDVEGGSALYRTLVQYLAREPVAILVELSGMTVTEPDAAQAFAMVSRQADIWPGTPVLLCAPTPATATLITNASGDSLPLFRTIGDGLSALTGHDEHISELLHPVPGAARRARDIVTEACLRWDVPHLTPRAVLVASELVSNVVVHAHTVMTLQARLRPRFLYLAVYDGSHAEPVRRDGDNANTLDGRGLQLVERASARWGYLRRTDGKVVWASLATSATTAPTTRS